jgi:hypothetical protein
MKHSLRGAENPVKTEEQPLKSNRVSLFVMVLSLLLNVVLLILLTVNNWQHQAQQYRRSYSTELGRRVHLEIEGLPAYLLSGSPDDAQQIADAHRELQQLVRRHSVQMKTPMDAVESEKLGKDEEKWYSDLATPLMEARRQVDSGRSRLADMQMTYLQKDPGNYSEILKRDIETIRAKLEE